MIGYRLKSKSENLLDGYIFSDYYHARKWLSQAFVKKGVDYKVQIFEGRLTKCCNRLVPIKILETLTPSEFLKNKKPGQNK